ncbi:MAG: hypothetical protein ACFFCP_02220 [Promethearchaeota archaeon]
MITRSELRDRWQNVSYPAPEPGEEESVSVLYENDWVRILAIRTITPPEEKRIEVEVSIPPNSVSFQSVDPANHEIRRFIQNLIRHLEYLLNLADAGLKLALMTREGIYTAYLEIKNSLSDNVLDSLLPPKI